MKSIKILLQVTGDKEALPRIPFNTRGAGSATRVSHSGKGRRMPMVTLLKIFYNHLSQRVEMPFSRPNSLLGKVLEELRNALSSTRKQVGNLNCVVQPLKSAIESKHYRLQSLVGYQRNILT
jgi:hypothetical protein